MSERYFCSDCNKPSDYLYRCPPAEGLFCKECHAKRKTAMRAVWRVEKVQDGLSKAVSDAIARAKDIPSVQALCSGIIHEFGGVEAFCRAWHQDILDTKEGSMTRLNQYYNIFKLIHASDQQRREMAPLEAASEEEIKAAIEKYVYKVVRPPEESVARSA